MDKNKKCKIYFKKRLTNLKYLFNIELTTRRAEEEGETRPFQLYIAERMRSMSVNTLDILAEKSEEVDLNSLPKEVIQKAKISLMDALECCIETINDIRLQGTYQAISKIFPEVGEESGGATLFGASGLSDAKNAAFYNVVTGSISARNDIHKEGSSHPGESVVPAALALAEVHHRSGKAVLESIVMGYETMIRLGKTLKSGSAPASPSLRRAALPVPLGIAFTAAKVLGFSREKTANAAALSCNNLCGVNEWRIWGTGEDVFQNAWAASNGIFAAELAQAGVQGASLNLEGEYGLLSVFGAEKNSAMMAEGFGKQFEMLNTMNKPVAACLSIQAPCQLAQDLLDDPSFSLDLLDYIEVRVSSHIMEAPWYARKDVDNQVSAILSVPYGISAVLAAGNISLMKWAPPYEDKIYHLMQKCRMVYDGFSEAHLEPSGFQVTAVMKDGSKIQKTRLDFSALSDGEVEDRFFNTMARHFDMGKAEKMLDMAKHLEEIPDAASFSVLFRK